MKSCLHCGYIDVKVNNSLNIKLLCRIHGVDIKNIPEEDRERCGFNTTIEKEVFIPTVRKIRDE